MTDLLRVAEEDFEKAAELVKRELDADGQVAAETRARHERTWRWLCAYALGDHRPDAELPRRVAMLRRLLRLAGDRSKVRR